MHLLSITYLLIPYTLCQMEFEFGNTTYFFHTKITCKATVTLFKSQNSVLMPLNIILIEIKEICTSLENLLL